MKDAFMVYMVGISGSGKTTIAVRLEERLKEKGITNLQVIDGDVIRRQFGGIFGYTYEERMKCNQAVRVVVRYLLDNGINVVLTQVGAYKAMRDAVRNLRNPSDGSYAEVYVKCSAEECARRDVKGYYASGIKNLNGTTDDFEEPQNSEIVVDTEKQTAEEAADMIARYLEEHGYGI